MLLLIRAKDTKAYGDTMRDKITEKDIGKECIACFKTTKYNNRFKKGIIKAVTIDLVAVEFDSVDGIDLKFHSCHGTCKPRKGWFFRENEVEIIDHKYKKETIECKSIW